MMPQTLRINETPRGVRSGHSMPPTIPPTMPPTMPLRQMAVYAVQLNQDGSAKQAMTSAILPVHMPDTKGPIIIKANLGKEEGPREVETTADKDGESDLTCQEWVFRSN